MLKNVFILILCFTLLFVAFNQELIIGYSSIFDDIDGHRQLFFKIPDEFYYEKDDFLIYESEFYICNYHSKDSVFSFSDWISVSPSDVYSNPVYDYIFYNYEVEPYFDFLNQIDGKIDFWYQFTDPSSSWITDDEKMLHDGDFWFNTSNEIAYSWVFDDWVVISEDEAIFYPDNDLTSFNEIFEFGYEVTFGTLETITSIFKGPAVFFNRFDLWRKNLFGDVTILSFISSWIDRSVDMLDSIALKIPLIKDLKTVIDTILLPFENIISDVIEWITDKIFKE